MDGRTNSPALALWVGGGIAILSAALDAGLGTRTVAVSAFLLAPLVALLLGGWRETALVSLLAFALAACSGFWHHNFGRIDYDNRLVVLALGGVIATVGAAGRSRTNANLARFELLAAIADIADGTLTLSETVDRVLSTLVPTFADVASLDGVEPDGSLRRLGARADGADHARVEAALGRRRQMRTGDQGVSRAALSGQSQLTEVTDEHLRAVAGSEEDFRYFASIGLRDALYIPLRSRGRVIGAFACVVGASGRRYDRGDLRFAEVAAGRIALALDNAGLSATVSVLEQRQEATLANLAEAVLVRDGASRIVYANPAAVGLFSAASAQELASSPTGEFTDKTDFYDEEGHVLTLEDIPGAHDASGEGPHSLLVRNVVRATGEARWLRYKASEVRGADGSIELLVSVIEDVTEVKRAEFAQRLLADAGRTLVSSLDYLQTLQEVAQLAVPQLADWCGVVIRSEDDELNQVAVAHVDPEKTALVRAFGERYPSRMQDRRGAANVIRSGVSQVIPQLTEQVLAAANLDAEQLQMLRDLQMRSVIIVPLAVAGQPPLGALSLVMAESGRVFSAEDVLLAEELGRRAGTAVENARLYTERSAIAHTLQQNLLPPQLPEIPGFQLASMYRAAGDQNEAGGDFYDAFEVAGGWMVVIGDVAGRGAEAAVLTALARYTLRTVGRFVGEPLAMVEHLNEALRERHDFSLVSVCCALLYEERGTASARVVLAGHPPAYLVRGGIPEQIGDFGTLPGAREIGNWSEVTVTLAPGDQLVLYTDGVIDTVGESERFGEDRLRDALIGASGAADAVSRIETGISRFERGAQADDTAVLAVQRTTRGDVSDAGPASGLAGESAPARLEPRGSRFTAASGRVSPQR